MDGAQVIAIVGCGTIGCSFAALHLSRPENHVIVYDNNPSVRQIINETLVKQTGKDLDDELFSRVHIAASLAEAVSSATIIHEAGPENDSFKSKLWPEVEKLALPDALFFSSTSGIPASKQSIHMQDPSRLVVCHPFNPAHILPLLEVVPGPQTSNETLERTTEYWNGMGREPVVIRKECVGFVANRLAFALLKEAINLVNEDVIGVEDLDRVVQTSMGPRWCIAGPFKSYHAGGGTGGMEAFLRNIGGTVQDVWQDLGTQNVGKGEPWESKLNETCKRVYGVVDTSDRDEKTRKVLAAASGLN